MTYRVELERRAERDLGGYRGEDLGRMMDVIDGLGAAPRPPGAKKLTAKEGYRLRVRSQRILYVIDDAARLVRIYRIGHRREVYR